MILRLFLFCVLALCCISSPTWAQKAQGAPLKTALNAAIKTLEKQTRAPVTFDFDGELHIEDTESHQAITLPYLTLLTAENTIVDIGFIAINAVTNEAQDGWDLAIALPTPITMKDAESGETINALHIGTQKTSLSWTQGDSLSGTLTVNLSEISLKNKDGVADPLFPTAANYTIALDNAPLSDVITLYTTSLQSVQAMPELAPLTWLSLAIKIPNMLARSGATLTVSDTTLNGANYASSLDGVIKASPEAKNLATGEFKLTTAGLNDLIEKIRIRMEGAQAADQKASYESLLNTLSAVKVSSQVIGDDESISHQVHLKMAEDGTVTLNEEPYSVMGNIINMPALLKLFMPPQSENSNPSE